MLSKKEQQFQIVGFDYGIKPYFMVIGDIEYPNLIHEGKPLAMGYGKIPYFGLLIEPPFTCLIFENEIKGRECFQHFKKWTEASKDGDAVSLSFIEKNEGGYAVCVYPEFSRLLDRCIPKFVQAEVDPLIVTPVSFPLTVGTISQHYLAFKQQTKQCPFVFCGASKTGELFLDIAIRKRQVQFHKENEIPKSAPENIYFDIESRNITQPKFKRKPPLESPERIRKRRWKRLKTFLPITLERLKCQSSFQSSRNFLLSENFAHWQILQAACNIVVSIRMCEKPHFQGLAQESAQAKILEYLLNTFEEPNVVLPPNKYFSTETLRKQIIADTIELLKHLGKEPKDDSRDILLSDLRQAGFLSLDE